MTKNNAAPKPQQIKRVHNPEVLQTDAARYAKEAVKLGATDAKSIKASEIVIDERVRLRCMLPMCYCWGHSIYCPPHGPAVETCKSLVAKFQLGVLMKMEVDPHILSGYNLPEVVANLKAGREDPDAPKLMEFDRIYHVLYDMVGKIEAMAFYDGYHLAMCFAAGTCNVTLCQGQPCLVRKGGTCRFPLRARPSMEAFAMDVYRTVTKVGWAIYPLGCRCDLSEVKHGTLVGLVLLD